MKHEILDRIYSSTTCESFLVARCYCGWKSHPVSNMHDAQLNALSSMERNHMKIQTGDQHLFIGTSIEVNGEYEYYARFLFWSTDAGSHDAYRVALKISCARGMEEKWDGDLRMWVNNDGTGFKEHTYREVDKDHEAILVRYL